ncbi:AraC family transcriptional regulator [Actinomadura madurae]|uniref:AraC family transcriptional regulator n=1 Tax=Actinomadura madurae TaxID=1993 RepID=UPI0020272AA0|nr:AraC family transcriptional regulator [Actinomadura madurae]MCP9955279.1 AraC family transcriptional regulator [Actinomadura madurae]MCP9972014.1 AraC family transcriptional regulator [Actinomadura madurae]MCP9984518.1 AraC family transcriptional regulator [Actinomadura madurae]MCQ0003931.1 AraC family transcriptional regulator [Actinomadura madurae]MCQ0020707.1 AraC family transcriptional regulator [Actinomadura madurae]
MSEVPVQEAKGLAYITDGSVAYAGHHFHETGHPVHTHSFVEVAVVTGGHGVHRTLTGRMDVKVGDAILLRPGVWHGYEDCQGLNLYNCCFSNDLLQREFAWTREDPLLGYLLWTGPNSMQRRGILTTRLNPQALETSTVHLDELAGLRGRPADRHRADIIGRLALFLGHLARAVAEEIGDVPGVEARTHPAVLDAMRLLESRLAHKWTLDELAEELHLTPRYIIRLFRTATGLPPMAYLAQHRVEKAAYLLLHTDQPITQIGRAVGWADQNYFARRFKAHYGLTASTYRKRFTHPSVLR